MAASKRKDDLGEMALEIARRKQELARLENEFRRRVDAVQPPEEREPTVSTPLVHRIQDFIDSSREIVTAMQIAEMLHGEYDIETIRTTLSKMRKAQSIARVGHGQYCSWAVYPERGRRPEGG